LEENQPFKLTKQIKLRLRKKVLKRLKRGHPFKIRQIDKAIKKASIGFNPIEGISFLKNSGDLCIQCGICCRKCYPIRLEAIDIQRISTFKNISINQCYIQYVDIATEGYFCIKGDRPCRFLARDNTCTIYSARPYVCRIYPFTSFPRKVTFEPDCGILDNIIMWKAMGLLVISHTPPQLAKQLKEKMNRKSRELHKKYENNDLMYANEFNKWLKKGGLYK